MIDNHGHRHRPDALFLGEQVFHIDMQVDRPAEGRDVLHAAIENIEADVAARSMEQIEADSANAAVV
jgi:RNA binding exosome subunit